LYSTTRGEAVWISRLAKPSALPVQMLGLAEEDEKHIGERYIVRARVAEWGGVNDFARSRCEIVPRAVGVV
jgi:hypothetical protein